MCYGSHVVVRGQLVDVDRGPSCSSARAFPRLNHPAGALGTFYVILWKPLGHRRGLQSVHEANWGMRHWVANLQSL